MNAGPSKILVIDEDCSVLYSLQKVLQFEGYETMGLADGRQAVNLQQTQQCQLIMLDLTMGNPDGLAVFEQLRQHFPLVPIILVIARFNRYDSVQIGGADALIEKPINIDQLLKTLRTLLCAEEQRVFKSNECRRLGKEISQHTITKINFEIEFLAN